MFDIENKRAKMEKQITAELVRWGIPTQCNSHPYFAAAILQVCAEPALIEEPIGKLYPALAKQFGEGPDALAGAMRDDVKRAWQGEDNEICIFCQCPDVVDVIGSIAYPIRAAFKLYEGADIVTCGKRLHGYWIAVQTEKGACRIRRSRPCYEWHWRGYDLIAEEEMPDFSAKVVEKRSGRAGATLGDLEELYQQKGAAELQKIFDSFAAVLDLPTKEELDEQEENA